MKSKFVILLLSILTVAIYSVPKSAESLRWSTADGYDCETTDNLGSYTCCKNITVVIGGVTLSANRCVDCGESMEGVVSCGSAYFTAATSLDIGGVVDPNIKNHAKDLIGQGLTHLNQGTLEGGKVDPKVKNSALALIGQGLTVLTKGGTEKGTVDPKVTKDANALIDRILSADKMIIKAAENIKIPKTGGLNDGGLLKAQSEFNTSVTSADNNTKTPRDFGTLKDKLLLNDGSIDSNTSTANKITTSEANSPRTCSGCAEFKKVTTEFEKDVLSQVTEGQDPDTIYRQLTTLFDDYQQETFRIFELTPPSGTSLIK